MSGMKTSEALRKAKDHLWDGIGLCPKGKHVYVCHASLDKSLPAEVYPKVYDVIGPLLEGETTLEKWLVRKGGLPSAVVFHSVRKVQVTRHAWLAHLIDFYERQGD